MPENSCLQSNINCIVLVLLCFLFFACAERSFKSEAELWAYLKNPENGYLQQKEINGVKFSFLYKPTAVLIGQEWDSKDLKKYQELQSKYADYLYFNLSLAKNNAEILSNVDRTEFGAMVNQLAFGLGDKVHLYTNKKDTLELLDYNYPRMYGMSKSTDILFVYPKHKKVLDSEYLTFTIEDIGLQTGEVKFKLPISHITKQPKLMFP